MAGYTEKGNKSGRPASQSHLLVHVLSQPKRAQHESQQRQNLQSYTIIYHFSTVLTSYDLHRYDHMIIPPLLVPSPLQILFQVTETTSHQ